MLVRSPSAESPDSSGSTCLSTGRDSPVSAASCTLRRAASTRRRSAGTMFPASSSTRSPGTRSRAATSRTCPSRMTRACGAPRRRSAAMVRSARYSWTNPMMAFRTTMTTMAMASCGSPTAPATAAAARSTTIMKSVNWLASIRQGERRSPSASSFGPCCAMRRCASPLPSPAWSSVPRRDAACATSSRCQSGTVSMRLPSVFMPRGACDCGFMAPGSGGTTTPAWHPRAGAP